MMTVEHYDLDRSVFWLLKQKSSKEELKQWQGAASDIAGYVSSWGVERFWAMSRSSALRGGEIAETDSGDGRRYFAWEVARQVLCEIVGQDLGLNTNMTTAEFQEQFRGFNFNQQVLLTDLLLEIADAVQFWTMRIKDASAIDMEV